MNFAGELLQWYEQNKRELPWRNTTDPYVIWLSEIILQQTRVEQGLPYFHHFLNKYPDVSSFAAAEEGDILKLWQGLGYYSRGRNMLKTAKVVQEQYQGSFPSNYNQLLRLKGIGAYTAAAISSFSANEARAVVDGNVYRILARYFGIDEPVNSTKGKKIFQALADEVLDRQRPGLHNQAMMEFGAMLCKPKNPACGICPVRTGCFAFLNRAIGTLPVKLKKAKVRDRFFNYLVIADGERIVMNKRGENDIWANMYDLPLIETAHILEPAELALLPQLAAMFGADAEIINITPVYRHLLTHQRLHIRFINLKAKGDKLQQKWRYIEKMELKNLAMPKIIFIFIKNFFNL